MKHKLTDRIYGVAKPITRAVAVNALMVMSLSLFLLPRANALPKCPYGTNPSYPGHIIPCASPIIVDTDGNGFHLTSADDGVYFDIAGDGRPIKMAWTAAGSTNAFLALPKDGQITNGKELFGDFTEQPPSDHPNGFLALAVYDKPENGGNGDGFIDYRDAVFPKLVLWIDANHDGIAQPEEMHSLPELGVFSISLHYTESRREDQYGNLFRYKSRINLIDDQEDDSRAGPVTYDVFFRIEGLPGRVE